MSLKLSVLTLALCLAACSQDRPAQPPAQAGEPQALEQASTPSAAPDAAKPANAVPATTGAPAPAGASDVAQRSGSSEASPESETPAGSGMGDSRERPGTPAASDRANSAKTAAAAEPRVREVTIPEGTALVVRLSTKVASDTSEVEDEVRGTLTEPIVRGGVTAVPAGAEVIGSVRSARRSGRVKGRASIAFRFDRLLVRDDSLAIRTAMVSLEAEASTSDDVKKGAIGAAAGAIVGGIVGGGRGAAIGAGVGGTGAVVATRGDEVSLEEGTTVRTTLQQPLKILVPLK